MARELAALAVLLSCGCGGSEAAAVPDAAVDAPTDAATIADTAPDGPPVYCSLMCGAVASSDVPDVGQIIVCPPGRYCGETGGVAGWICCSGAECLAGTQHGYGCP
jgi:hypothetical protein